MSKTTQQVIDQFVGRQYVSDGTWNGIPADMAEYFPGQGVTMSVERHDAFDFSYAKVKISDSPAKATIEASVYRVQGENLVARDIELRDGILMTETLMPILDQATGKATQIVHRLDFSDGTSGLWTCK